MPSPRVTELSPRLLLAVLALAACEPTPDYAPFDPKLPGLIEVETELVIDGDDVWGSYRVGLRIPPGALPLGTHVKVRTLIGIDERPIVGARLAWPWSESPTSDDRKYRALQILPESLTFARPATLEALSFVNQSAADNLCAVVLFARGGDTTWQPAGMGTVRGGQSGVDVIGNIDRGGIWSMAYTAGCPSSNGGADASAD